MDTVATVPFSSTRAYVLETGKIVASGTTAELAHHPFVEGAYLATPGRAS